MATIAENTLTMAEGSDVYTMRPMILSDKTFFIESMADFPYEVSGVNSSRTFDKYMYMWVTSFQDFDLPVKKGTRKVSTFIILKNSVPFCMIKLTYDYNCLEGETALFDRDSVTAFHPSQRGKGLYRKYLDIVHYWIFKVIGVEYSTYETFDKVVQILHIQKANNYDYIESKPAGLQGTKHIFKIPKAKYSEPSGYTFKVTKATYDLTNERYATPAVQATYLTWDSELS